MTDIVVEKVTGDAETTPPLVDQINGVLEEISLELRKSVRRKQESAVLDAWLNGVRDRFWERQFELFDGPDGFRVRMAVPGFFQNRLRAVVSEGGIDVLDDHDVLVRRVPLPGQVEWSTVSAIFKSGYLHVTGSKVPENVRARSARAAG